MLERCTVRTKSLREAHPRVKAPRSIFEGSLGTESGFGDATSTVGASEFEFDDLIVNSQVYRRALAAARLRNPRLRGEKADAEGNLIDLSEPSENEPGPPGDHETFLADLRSLSFPMKNESDDVQVSPYVDTRERAYKQPRSLQASENLNIRSLETKVEEGLLYKADGPESSDLRAKDPLVKPRRLGCRNLEDLAHIRTCLSQITEQERVMDKSSTIATSPGVFAAPSHETISP